MALPKTITYDPITRDYRMELDGLFIGYARNQREADMTLNQTAYEWLTHGYTATQMDGGAGDPPAPEPPIVIVEAPDTTPPESHYTRAVGFDDPRQGDAWRDARGLLRWVAVGHDPNYA